VSSKSTLGALELSGAAYNRSLDLGVLGDGSLSLGAAGGQTVVYGGASLRPGTGNIYRLGGTVEGSSSTPTLVIQGTDNVLTGTASLLVTGGVNLLNANDYSGGTVANGPIGIGNDAALGTGQVQLGAGGLRSLQGAHSLANSFLVTGDGAITLSGLAITGPVDLNGRALNLFSGSSGSSVSFTNSITNGTLVLNQGRALLSGSNQLSSLQVYLGTVVVASEANLGGSGAPLRFAGRFNDPIDTGTLETTASFTLSKPISFFNNSNFGSFNVDAGTTLTLAQTVSGGSLLKQGSGTLLFAPGAVLSGGDLEIYGGRVNADANAFSGASGVYLYGGTFAGSGRIQNTLYMSSGAVTPAGGHGIIVAPFIASGPVGSSALQFEFTTAGSPNYLNLADGGNGTLAFGMVGWNSGGAPMHISIYLNAGSIANGEFFKGGLYFQSLSNAALLPIAFDYTYYVADPAGSINFDGATFSLLDPAKFAISQSWVTESADFGGVGSTSGQVEKFQVAALPEPQSLLLLASAALCLSVRRPRPRIAKTPPSN